jgi:DNA-binding response OmpR family regulator
MAPSKRILIVDVALELGRLLQAALKTLDDKFEVIVMPSAEEGMLEVSRKEIDLVIADVRLAGISGLEFTRRLRIRSATLAIIQISSLSDPGIKEQALANGANAFFKKPLVMPEFLQTVEQLLRPAPAISPAAQIPAEMPGSPRSERLVEVLQSLQVSVGAYSVALLDQGGHALMHAGEPLEGALPAGAMPLLVAAVDSSRRMSVQLGHGLPENVLVFKGKPYTLVVQPVGEAFLFVIALRYARSTLRVSIAVDEALAAQQELAAVLLEMGLALTPDQRGVKGADDGKAGARRADPRTGLPRIAPLILPDDAAPAAAGVTPPAGRASPTRPFTVEVTPVSAAATKSLTPPPAASAPVAEAPTPIDEKMAADLATLLGKPEKDRLKTDDLDAFWETASEAAGGGKVNPNAIPYEEARRMGLTPDDIEGKK